MKMQNTMQNTMQNAMDMPNIANMKNSLNTSCNRTGGMPIHRIGPVIGFHESFNKYNKTMGVGNPTGIPEMGWRNIYLANYSKNEVPDQDPFAGIITRDFLDNLENVDNIYRKY